MQKSARIDEESFSRFFSFPSQQLHLLGFTRIADECKIFYHLYDLFAHTWPSIKYPKQKLPAVACESTYTKLRLLYQMNDIKSDGFHKRKKAREDIAANENKGKLRPTRDRAPTESSERLDFFPFHLHTTNFDTICAVNGKSFSFSFGLHIFGPILFIWFSGCLRLATSLKFVLF